MLIINRVAKKLRLRLNCTRKYQKVRNEHGMTLVEVMIAAAILGVSGLGLMEITNLNAKNAKNLADYVNWYDLLNTLRNTYSNKQICTSMFKNLAFALPATSTPPSGAPTRGPWTQTLSLSCLGVVGNADGTCGTPIVSVGDNNRGFQIEPSMSIQAIDPNAPGIYTYTSPPPIIGSPPPTTPAPTQSAFAYPAYLRLLAKKDSTSQRNFYSGSTDLASDPTNPNTIFLMLYFNPSNSALISCDTFLTGRDLPSGSIMPFTTSCPSGWILLTNGQGRTLIGTGANFAWQPTSTPNWNPPIGAVGTSNSSSNDQITLNLNHTPYHTHSASYNDTSDSCVFANGSSGGYILNSYDSGYNIDYFFSDYSGGRTYYDTAPANYFYQKNSGYGAIPNNSHNNVPPFYVVNWCKKS